MCIFSFLFLVLKMVKNSVFVIIVFCIYVNLLKYDI